MYLRIPYIFAVILFVFITHFSQGSDAYPHLFSKAAIDFKPMDTLLIADTLENLADSYSEKWFNRDPRAQFVRAYAMFKKGNYTSSQAIFKNLYLESKFLTEYSSYFYIKSLWYLDQAQALEAASEYIKKYEKHSLSDSLIIPVADALFEKKSYTEARKYYLMAAKQNNNQTSSVYAQIQSAYCLYFSKSTALALEGFYQILRKYPSQGLVLELAENLKIDEPDFFNQNFFSFVDVFFENARYEALRIMLEKYIKTEQNLYSKEEARYHLLKLYLVQKRYKTALYGFLNLLNTLQNQKLEPYLRINIARTYYQMGNKRNAIEAYLDYAKRYPRRRMAAETTWKSAWIYEELGELESALGLYRDLRKRWPESSYAKEAFFREGFTLYRLQRYKEADAVFTNIRLKNWPDIEINRAYYWSAMCRNITGDSLSARNFQIGLAKHLWDDYYTMKSYLLHKTHLDSSWKMIQEFKKSANAMQYYGNGLTRLLNHFEIAFQIRELLGESYGFAALSDIKLSASSWEEWMALAEIYKKFGAYNKAYRIYDHINYKYFGDKSYIEKAFMLKERFPFYYDDIINKYSQRYNLESEFVLALIKQESIFDPTAHSAANAHGLMQLMPATAGDMAHMAGISLTHNALLFQPEINIHLGSLYLKQLNRQFNGYKERILAAYNAGPHRVMRWKDLPGSDEADVFIENIEYKETRDYVRKVMKNYWAYKLLAANFNLEYDQIIYGYLDTRFNQTAAP